MRIISGKYKKVNLEGFTINGTRPTMDRVKESMFAMIQNHIKDTIVLDLFAGSGALGIEALSMGAKKCYFVDNNAIAIDTIRKNGTKLSGANYQIIKQDFVKALEILKDENQKFDLILLDPPYQSGYLNESIRMIAEYNLLNSDGLIVCEYEDIELEFNCFKIYKEKKFGSKIVTILENDL